MERSIRAVLLGNSIRHNIESISTFEDSRDSTRTLKFQVSIFLLIVLYISIKSLVCCLFVQLVWIAVRKIRLSIESIRVYQLSLQLQRVLFSICVILNEEIHQKLIWFVNYFVTLNFKIVKFCLAAITSGNTCEKLSSCTICVFIPLRVDVNVFFFFL